MSVASDASSASTYTSRVVPIDVRGRLCVLFDGRTFDDGTIRSLIVGESGDVRIVLSVGRAVGNRGHCFASSMLYCGVVVQVQ